MIIEFDRDELEDFLRKIGCDECQYFVRLEGTCVVHNWESNFQGKITKHSDIELHGRLVK